MAIAQRGGEGLQRLRRRRTKRRNRRTSGERVASQASARAGEKGEVAQAMEKEEEETGKRLWGGRFVGGGATDPVMERLNVSLPFDKRMFEEDVRGSVAYAGALHRSGLIEKEEHAALERGLLEVRDEWASGAFEVRAGDEDIHTANERRLSEIIGDGIGGKLHTGRSRNDQVATDTRLWLMRALRELRVLLRELISVAAQRAEAEVDVIMPGFTHLQPAQAVRWSHWLMSHASAWRRDDERLAEVERHVATLPLGSGAIAGNPFKVDRQQLARELGFTSGVCANSMDAVSDRDFVLDTMYAGSMFMTHLSRWAEDLIIYSTAQFDMVSLSELYSTGSSLMPQKRNPDALELLRGKSGRCIGHLTGMLATVKGTPSTYNKDLQEDKEPLFDLIQTLDDCVRVAHGCLSTLTIKPEKMKAALTPDMLATDLADYLVRKGVPFRETHHISGSAVRLAEDRGVPLTSLTVADLKPLCPSFEEDVESVWDFERSVEARDSEGGTSRRAVLEQVAKMKSYLGTSMDPTDH